MDQHCEISMGDIYNFWDEQKISGGYVYRPPVEPTSGSSQPLAELHKETFRIFQASVFSVVCLLIFTER